MKNGGGATFSPMGAQPHSSSILPAKTHSRLASLVERLLSICPIHYQRKVNLSLNMRWKQNERYRKRVSEEEAVVVVGGGMGDS